MIEFSENDLKQLKNKGVSREKVLEQIETFKAGIPFVRLDRAAVVSAGISRFTEEEEEVLIRNFESLRKDRSLLKFVPASGAASRMFKSLFNFLDSFNPRATSLTAYLEKSGDRHMAEFFEKLDEFPFSDIVQKRIRGKSATRDEEYLLFVREMLSEEGLNYGFYPKGLLPFHNYGSYTATPFEEHLIEGASYACVNDKAFLHFTISEQHAVLFNREFAQIRERVALATNTGFHVSYSYQKSSTDTIAVTMENTPFRNDDGSLLFRPGGHGALIENLDEQETDIIFIKNIDNVVVPEYAEDISNSKKVLAGLLLKVQQKAFYYAELLDNEHIDGEILGELKTFLHNELNVRFSDKFESFSIEQQLAIYKDKINRPIRICGMVKNAGEPGGGPFWIRDRHGHISLQIIESAQVDMEDEEQVAIFKNSTHFNPVDLVCGVKNYRGEKFNLLNFVDKNQGFITLKTKDGKNLKALELPGLWNGAMAFWNTIFVEVPLLTFNPVKTVNDLLKPAHRVK
ncbi:MAG TPA: DUF4301 family protein [Eudoraea sp.]|nr:DUF4301 family protein [Eudoraea sp.]